MPMREPVPMESACRRLPGHLLLLGLCLLGLAEAQDQTPLPDPHFHLYLLIGQSNMAGRGVVDEESTRIDPRVSMLAKDLTWQPAKDPLHFDKPAAGVGPGLAFGKQLAQAEPQVRIGLIPCAVGGTSITVWVPGATDKATATHPYDDMLRRVREATKAGVLTGIIWHQGESDVHAHVAYAQSLTALIARLRQDLAAGEIPFVAGELSNFKDPADPDTAAFNAALHELAQTVPHVGWVSAAGLEHKGDFLHYNAASARTLGQRYAAKMLDLQH